MLEKKWWRKTLLRCSFIDNGQSLINEKSHILKCGFWLKRANCPSSIYFLGSSPRHDSRIYLIARINSQFSSISRSFLSPTKLNFVGTPLDLVVRRKYKKRTRIKRVHQVDGNYLFSRVVSNQISSTCKSLTFVFGMGTSGTS